MHVWVWCSDSLICGCYGSPVSRPVRHPCFCFLSLRCLQHLLGLTTIHRGPGVLAISSGMLWGHWNVPVTYTVGKVFDPLPISQVGPLAKKCVKYLFPAIKCESIHNCYKMQFSGCFWYSVDILSLTVKNRPTVTIIDHAFLCKWPNLRNRQGVKYLFQFSPGGCRRGLLCKI